MLNPKLSWVYGFQTDRSRHWAQSLLKQVTCWLLCVEASMVFLFWLRLYVPVNNFPVMSGWSHRFLGITGTFWEVNVSCSRIQHGDPSKIEPPTSRSGVRHSTTRPPRLPGTVVQNLPCKSGVRNSIPSLSNET